jgi:hypothetical protein
VQLKLEKKKEKDFFTTKTMAKALAKAKSRGIQWSNCFSVFFFLW